MFNRRNLITVVVTAIAIAMFSFTAAGSNAAAFSFMDSVKEFFGIAPTQSVVKLEPKQTLVNQGELIGLLSPSSTAVSYTGMGSVTCPTAPTATISPSVTGLTFSQMSRGIGVTCGTASTGISGSAFNVTLASAISSSKWYTLSITGDASTSFTVDSLSVVSQVSTALAGNSVDIQYSIGAGSKTSIGSFTPTASSATYSITPGTPVSVGAGQTINIFFIPNGLSAAGTTCRINNNTAISVTTTSIGGTPTKLAVTSISPSSPTAGSGFNVTVQSQDGSNSPANVVANTGFTLSNIGGGTIGGTTTGTITAGTNSVVVSGVTLSGAATGATLTATQTSGDVLTPGTSAPFNVLAAADHIAFVGVPTTGAVNGVLTAFTVEARRPDNTVDTTYTGNVVITKATGSGGLTGTSTKAAVAGVATFNDLQFDAADTYTLNANSSSFTQITSGNIVVTDTTIATDYFRSAATGDWGTASTWESSHNGTSGWAPATLAPTTSANTVTVRNGHTVTVAASVSADQLTVDAGGQITIASAQVLTIANGTGTDLVLNGTVVDSGQFVATGATWTVGAGGTFVYNSTTGISTPLGTATLDAASTFVYRGSSVLSPTPSLSGRTYGNLVFESTSGTYTLPAPSGAGSLTINGSLLIGSTGAGTVTYNTTGFTGLIPVAGGISIGAASSLTVGASTLTVGGDISTGTGGTFALSGSPLTVNGNWSNGGTFTQSTSTVTFGGGNPQTITTGGSGSGKSFNTLTINKSAGTATLAGALRATTLNISGGTLDTSAVSNYAVTSIGDLVINGLGATFIANASTISVGGNWTNTGNFNANTSLVSFGSGVTHNVSGNNQFYNFENLAGAGTGFVFEAGKLQTIFNSLTFAGVDGSNLLSLLSSVSGTQWKLASIPPRSVNFVDVKDSDASLGIGVINPTNSVDSGNNIRWGFTAVSTDSATLVTSGSATLNGTANPNGSATTGWFRYATTSPGTCNDSFGTRAPSSGGSSLGSGNTGVAYIQGITGLSANQTYYYCAIASNSVGTSVGSVLSFTTSLAPDYTITTTGNSIVINDMTGAADTLTMFEPLANHVQFTATGKTFSVDGGPNLPTNSLAFNLLGVTSITVNQNGGSDVMNVSAFTFTPGLPSMTLNGGTGDDTINIQGNLTFQSNANLDIDLQNDDASPGVDQVVYFANAVTNLSGTGSANIKASRSVTFNLGSKIAVVNGSLTVEANQQATPTAGAFWGVNVASTATLTTSGTGAISIKGRGGDDAATGAHRGIYISNGSITSTSAAAGAGTITLNGRGGLGTSGNRGVDVFTNPNSVTSVAGDISITGFGGAATTTSNFGVSLSGGAGVHSTGPAKITFDGTGGTGTDSNTGVRVSDFGTQVTSAGGDIHFVGQGSPLSTTGGSHGVSVAFGALVSATGGAKITLDGTAGGGTNGSTGVIVAQTDTDTVTVIPAKVTSDSGDISITGVGGTGVGTAGGNIGVNINSAAVVAATGTANVIINGTGGACTGVGASDCYGVDFESANVAGTAVTAVSGNITVNGTSTAVGGLRQNGIRFEDSLGAQPFILTTGTGSLTLTGIAGNTDPSSGAITFADDTAMTLGGATNTFIADTMDIGTSLVTINAGVNALELRQKTNGRAIDLGGADSATQLGLTDAELDVITAASFYIGNANTGTMTVSSDINRTAATNLILTTSSGSDINQSGGAIDTAGGQVSFNPGGTGKYFPSHSGVDVTTGGTFANLTTHTLKVSIDGTTPDSGYTQFNVAGQVSIVGSSLSYGGTYVPTGSEAFTIINNDGSDAVAGTFAGLPEGAVIPNFLGSGLNGTITYVGGTGNDVVITVQDVTPPDTTITSNPANPSNSASATFAFTGDDFGGSGVAGFECSLDGAAFTACSSTTTYTGLSDGPHTFEVRAKDVAGNTDPSPASFAWSIDATAPDTLITASPADPSNSSSAAFSFTNIGTIAETAVGYSSVPPPVSFECQIDGGGFTACTSPKSYTGLSDGAHTFQVRAKDLLGNTDATPATFNWSIDTAAPVIANYTALSSTNSTAPRNFAVTVTDGTAVSSVTVYYTVTPGSPGTVICVPSGNPNEWTCSTPGAGVGSAVSYYVGATDTLGNSSANPAASAPNLYTVAGATVPAGSYSSMHLYAGSTLGGNVTVDGPVSFYGVNSTGAFTLTLGCGATVVPSPFPGAFDYVVGTVQKDFCGTGAFTFPIGTTPDGAFTNGPAGGFNPENTPFTANITSGTFPSSLIVSVVDGLFPGVDPAQSASRYWNVTEVGDLTADISFTYLVTDVAGTESNYSVLRRSGSTTAAYPGGSVNTVSHTATANGVSNFSSWGAGFFAPTAANVLLGGRVLTADGRGVKNAVVVVSGNTLTTPMRAVTGPFGYYQFDGLAAGETYVVTVNSKRYTFRAPSRVITLSDSVSDADFTADPPQ